MLYDFTVCNRTKRMGASLIIITYYCGKQCELLLNRFLIKELHHKLNLLCHLLLSSIIDDKIRPPPLFQPRVEKKIQPPTSSRDPPPIKYLDPHLHFDNSITGGFTMFFREPDTWTVFPLACDARLIIFLTSRCLLRLCFY